MTGLFAHIQSKSLELLELGDAELQEMIVAFKEDENKREVLMTCMMM